jgi:ABC-2 type transport system permease protein
VWLVARRELRAGLRGRSLWLGTVAGIVLLAAYLLVQGLVVNQSDTGTVGLTGQATALTRSVQVATAQLGLTVNVTTVTNQDQGLAEVRDGSLTALVTGPPGALQVTVKDQLDDRLRAALTGLVQQQALDAQLAEAGLKPSDVQNAVAQAQLGVTQLEQLDPLRTERLGVGLAAAVLLYFSLILLGNLLARGIVTERANRVVEVLLAALRPGRLLAGKVLGLGLLGFCQLLIVGLAGLGLAAATGVLDNAGIGFGALGSGLLWYVFGFAFYATLFGCVGSLVARLEDLQSVLMPIVLTASLGFIVGIDLLVQNPTGAASTVLSLLPPFAPFLMAGRMAVGAAAGWQVLLALLLMVAAIIAIGRFGGRVYATSVRTIDSRVSLKDALS